MSTHVCFIFFFSPYSFRCHQTTEPLSQLPQSTTTVTTTTRPATTTTTRSRLTTRSRIGGPKAGGLRLSIVVFSFPRLCEGLALSLCNISVLRYLMLPLTLVCIELCIRALEALACNIKL